MTERTQDVTIYSESDNNSLKVESDGSINDNSAITNFSQQVESTGDWYPNSLPELSAGEKSIIYVDNAGNLATRGPILTDEHAIFDHFSGSSLDSRWSSVVGTGASISVSDSNCVITSGTIANSETYIAIELDYLPINVVAKISISQRIANQDIYFELVDNIDPANTIEYARFHWNGIDANSVFCEGQNHLGTGGNEGSTIRFKSAYPTFPQFYWSITGNVSKFNFGAGAAPDIISPITYLNDKIPGPYTPFYLRIRVKNGSSAPASSTTISIDSVTTKNINRLDISNDIYSSPIISENIDSLYPAGYTNISCSGFDMNIYLQGGLNSFHFYPSFISETSAYTEDITYTNTSTTNFLQIFKPAFDTALNGIDVILGTAGTNTTIDNFDSSVTTNWISSDTSNTVVSQETTLQYEGTGCMKITTKSPKSNQDYIRRTISSSNFSTMTNYSFWFRSTSLNQQWKFRLSDGTNTLQSPIFSASVVNTWLFIELDINDFTEVGTGTTNLSAITRIEFLSNNNTKSSNYFDLLVRSVATLLDCDMQIYDFGTTSAPTNISQGTLITDDNGVDTIINEIRRGTRKKYTFDFKKGVSTNNKLTEGNYYGIYIKNKDIVIYGKSSKIYNSGDANYLTTSSGAITGLNKSAYFVINYCPDLCFLNEGLFSVNGESENSEVSMLVVSDQSTHTISQELLTGFHPLLGGFASFKSGIRFIPVLRGSHLHFDVNHNAEATNFTYLNFTGTFIRKSTPRNG